MKTTKPALLFLITVICAFFCVAQQTPPTPAPQSPVAIANNVQLVIEGKVINVHDGDTVTVLDQNNRKFHIRLQGIDAPELKQAFGSVSQQNLSRMVLGKQVSIFWTKVDKYRRTVGTIKLDGRDVNIEQVKAGLAWHFKKYEDEQEPEDRRTYAAAEQQARAAKLGLWQDANPTVPGEWRQEVKATRWGPPPPEGTIIGNKNSMKYHRPDCSGYRDMAEKNRVFFKTVEEAEAAGYKRAGNCPAESSSSEGETSRNQFTQTANPPPVLPHRPWSNSTAPQKQKQPAGRAPRKSNGDLV
jgi:endonuclease YncB( thermonuclease family)